MGEERKGKEDILLTTECWHLIGKCGVCAGVGKTKHFGVIRVKIRSGRNHQWMQYLRGHVDEKQDICITLKRLSVECLLLAGSRKKQH